MTDEQVIALGKMLMQFDEWKLEGLFQIELTKEGKTYAFRTEETAARLIEALPMLLLEVVAQRQTRKKETQQ